MDERSRWKIKEKTLRKKRKCEIIRIKHRPLFILIPAGEVFCVCGFKNHTKQGRIIQNKIIDMQVYRLKWLVSTPKVKLY